MCFAFPLEELPVVWMRLEHCVHILPSLAAGWEGLLGLNANPLSSLGVKIKQRGNILKQADDLP